MRNLGSSLIRILPFQLNCLSPINRRSLYALQCKFQLCISMLKKVAKQKMIRNEMKNHLKSCPTCLSLEVFQSLERRITSRINKLHLSLSFCPISVSCSDFSFILLLGLPVSLKFMRIPKEMGFHHFKKRISYDKHVSSFFVQTNLMTPFEGNPLQVS